MLRVLGIAAWLDKPCRLMAGPDSQEEGPEIGSKGIFRLILSTQVNSESM